MSKLVPLGRNVVIQDRAKENMKGSIHIPDSAVEKSYEAVVVAVGPDVNSEGFTLLTESEKPKKNKYELKAGDVVIYGKYAGDEVTVDGEKFRILKDTDLLAKIV